MTVPASIPGHGADPASGPPSSTRGDDTVEPERDRHPPVSALGEAVICVRDLRKEFGAGPVVVHAVRGVSLDIQRGSFTAIMGPSGSGKSTLLHLMAGLDRATSGQVWVEGQELTGLDDRAVTAFRRDRLGFVFQSFNLLPELTAEQNVLLPSTLARRRADRRELSALTAALGLADRLDHYPAQLSGGEQQRVAIARALVLHPAVVVADEPTGALDLRTGRALLAYLRRCADDGQTVLMVTHDVAAAAHADRVLVLRDGQLAADLTNASAEDLVTTMLTVEA